MHGKGKIKTRYSILYLFYSILFLFVSCEFNQPVRDYLEYWSSTCQVGKVEYASENVTIDDVPNLSASEPIEINLYTVNPKSIRILCNENCFSLQNEAGDLSVTDYSETMVDPTYVKIRANLSDASEGQRITLSGCLWPENRLDFPEADLRTSSPELFYTTSFIQNTPPDNIKNLQRAENFFPGTQKCYVSFEVPDQSLNRNKDSTYEVKYFFRNDNNSLEYKGSKVLTLADNKNPSAGSDVFMYYFDGQNDNFLNCYEYTVQVTGPRGLTVGLRATDPALGACVLVEPSITVLDIPNGLYDEDSDGDYECYEVESEADSITFTAVPGQEGDTLTVKDNGTVLTPTNGNTYTVSGLGRHEIKATSSRTDAFSVTVTKRLRIVVTPMPATFTFDTNDTDTYFNDMTDTSGYEYLEVPQSTSTVGYTISPTEEGTTLSGTVDGTDYNGPVNGVNIDVGPHTLVAVIHKQYCNDVTTTRKIMVAKTLEAPVYTFDPDLNEKKVGGYEYLEVSSSTAKANCTITASSADSNAKVSVVLDGGTASTAASQYDKQIGVADHTFTVTVSKDYMISREFTRYIKVDSKLTPPEIAFTSPAPNGKRDDLYYEYIEVNNSSSKASYTVTNKDSRDGTTVSTVVTAMPDDTQVSTSDSGYLDAGIPGSPKKYKIVATVTKDGYVEQRSTKFVAVVAKLKTPQITFGSAFNGKGQDSDGYYYIEVSNTTDTVSYLSSTEDNDGTNNPVTLTTKINGVAKNTIGSLGIGDYEIEVTAHCSFQNDVSFTQKVRVVQELQEPTYSFTPGLTSESGNKWIEVPKTNHDVSCKITAKASGEKIKVTEGGTTLYNTGSSPANFTLNTLGDHTLTITVTKDKYKTQTFTKTIKIVEELQEPTIKVYKHDGNDLISPSSSAPEQSGYSDYTCYDLPLTTSGTGHANFEVYPASDNGSVSVKIDGTTVNAESNGKRYLKRSSGDDHLGGYTVTLTVTKDGYKPQEFTKKVYVQGILSAPTLEFKAKDSSGNYQTVSQDGTYNGYPLYKFSYIYNDTMQIYSTVGNTGNSQVIKVDGTQAASGGETLGVNGWIAPDTTPTITIVQTRTHCKTKPYEKTISVKIKPIKLKYHNARGSGQVGDARICLGGISGVGSFDLLGEVKINNQTIWGYGSSKYGVGTDQWDHLNTDTDERGYEETLYTPNDTIKLELINMKRRPDKESFGSHDVTKKLSEIKGYTIPTIYPYGGCTLEPLAGTSNEWIIYTGRKTYDGRYIYVYVKFSVSD